MILIQIRLIFLFTVESIHKSSDALPKNTMNQSYLNFLNDSQESVKSMQFNNNLAFLISGSQIKHIKNPYVYTKYKNIFQQIYWSHSPKHQKKVGSQYLTHNCYRMLKIWSQRQSKCWEINIRLRVCLHLNSLNFPIDLYCLKGIVQNYNLCFCSEFYISVQV